MTQQRRWNYEDWITVKISTPNLNKPIVCADGRGITYRPGTTKRFTGLWFPVSTQLTITLVQYNLFSKDDVASISNPMNSNSVGYYETNISLSQFRAGATIGLRYMGIGITIAINNYVQVADYYLLLEMHNEIVQNNTYGLDRSCRLGEATFYAILFAIILIDIISI